MGEAEQDWPALSNEQWARWWRQAGFRELRQILWRWDPIGVADDLPATEDEYDDYALGVAGLLRRAATAGEIADYLFGIETGVIELPTSDEKRHYVAELTRNWYPNSIGIRLHRDRGQTP